MPTIVIHGLERTLEEKRTIVQKITKMFEELGVNPKIVNVIFQKVTKEEYATGGKLVSDY
ncbi:MAG: tautomerase family protein [Nitrososphaerales archaeon]